MVAPRMIPAVNGNVLFRMIHSTHPCYEEQASTEAAPAEKPAEMSAEDQIAALKKQLEANEKEVRIRYYPLRIDERFERQEYPITS